MSRKSRKNHATVNAEPREVERERELRKAYLKKVFKALKAMLVSEDSQEFGERVGINDAELAFLFRGESYCIRCFWDNAAQWGLASEIKLTLQHVISAEDAQRGFSRPYNHTRTISVVSENGWERSPEFVTDSVLESLLRYSRAVPAKREKMAKAEKLISDVGAVKLSGFKAEVTEDKWNAGLTLSISSTSPKLLKSLIEHINKF